MGEDQPQMQVNVSPTDALHEYRITQLEKAVSVLSEGFTKLVTEVQRAKWVVGGAILVGQGDSILNLARALGKGA